MIKFFCKAFVDDLMLLFQWVVGSMYDQFLSSPDYRNVCILKLWNLIPDWKLKLLHFPWITIFSNESALNDFDSNFFVVSINSQNGQFSYGYASSAGKRSSMEDFYETRIDGVDGEIVGLFGVFDGIDTTRSHLHLIVPSVLVLRWKYGGLVH